LSAVNLDHFWINGGSDMLPTELECSVCGRTVGEISSSITLGDVVRMAQEHHANPATHGEQP
jgi:hypothetical protein